MDKVIETLGVVAGMILVALVLAAIASVIIVAMGEQPDYWVIFGFIMAAQLLIVGGARIKWG